MITIERQIECVQRELVMREKVYRKRVEQGTMREDKAADELAAMRAVLATLVSVQYQEKMRGAA